MPYTFREMNVKIEPKKIDGITELSNMINFKNQPPKNVVINMN